MRQSPAVGRWLCKCCERSSDCQLLQNDGNDLSSGTASHFAKKLGDIQVETIRKIQQSFGDDAMSITRIKEWYNRFKNGSTSVDSEPRHGRPSTSRNDNVIKQVRTLLMQNRRITVHKAKPTPKSTTRRYFVAFVMLCGANDRTCGQQKLGSSITTMHPPILRIWFKFLAKHNIPLICQAPYSPDMAPCDFWMFPKLKVPLKGTRLNQEKTLCRTWQPSWTWFHKKLSRNVSNNGRTAGRSVCITKEITLKGIRVSDIQINNCIFANQRYDTFWTHLVSSIRF